jgi:hypothetical protein
MTSSVRQLPPFEPFDVRLPKSVFEIIWRLELFGLALPLWGCWVIALALESLPENRDEKLACGLLSLVFLPLALFLTFLAMKRLVYWRVDQAGIQKRCLGVKIWDLPWDEITSYALGPCKREDVVVIGLVMVIVAGPYQGIVLENQAGRRRKVNRLATNGDRLDALVRYYLNLSGEAELGEGFEPGIEPCRQKSRCVRRGTTMGWIWDLIRVQAAYEIDVHSPIDEVVQRLRFQILPGGPVPTSLRQRYVGEVTDQGFKIRWFVRGSFFNPEMKMYFVETRPGAEVQGEFWPEEDRTRVAVVLRHGWLRVTWACLFLLSGLLGLWAGEEAIVLIIAGVLFHQKLWWDIRQIGREVSDMLTAGVPGGSHLNDGGSAHHSCRKASIGSMRAAR